MKRSILAVFAIILTTTLTSCGNSGDASYEKIYEKYSALKSYSTTAAVTVNSNLTSKEYKIAQYYMAPDKFKVEILFPESNKGTKYIFNAGNLRFVPPAGVNGIVSDIGNYVPSDKNYMFVPDFFESYVENDAPGYEVVRDIGGKQTILTSIMKNDNIYRFSQKMWVDNKTFLPSKLETYDIDGKPVITMEFEEFKWNEKLDDGVFER